MAKSGATGNLTLDMAKQIFPEIRSLDADRAYFLYRKLRIITGIVNEIELEEMERAKREGQRHGG